MSPSNSRYAQPQDANLVRWADGLDDDAREYFEERAAILEFDARLPRQKAERLAQQATLQYLDRRSSNRR